MTDHAWDYRSVTGTIQNKSGKTLTLVEPVVFDWGRWIGPEEASLAKIRTIPDGSTAQFEVECTRGSTGCEGRLKFTLDKDDKNRTWEIYWNNPFINCAWESNEYTQQLSDGNPSNADNDDAKTGDEVCFVRYVCERAPAAKVETPPLPDEQPAVVQPGQEQAVSVFAGPRTYHVFVVDVHKNKRPKGCFATWSDAVRDDVLKQLRANFDVIAKEAGCTIEVSWEKAFPSKVEDDELVCYLRPQNESKFSAAEKSAAPAGDSTGMTAWNGSTMMTEIWVEAIEKGHSDGAFAVMLCGLIMHELMHQKLDAHPDDAGTNIHGWPEPSYGHTPVTGQSRLAGTDAHDIAVALPKKYKPRKV